ncbi:MAG: hypothetical protein Tsb0020_37670 [Haliangiales bacterium]
MPPRRGVTRPITVVAVTAFSLALHGAGMALVHARVDLGAAATASTRTALAEAEKRKSGPLPSCEADEALDSAARLAMCALPGIATEACATEAIDEFRAGRVRCHQVTLPSAVTLLDRAKIDEIEPEPLANLIDPEVLEELKQQAPPPPPPEQVAQQQQAPPPPPAPALDSQVVEVVPETEEVPENTRFMADVNSRVEKQTVARASTEEMVARPDKSSKVPDDIAQPKRAEPVEETAGADPSSAKGPGELAMRALGLTQVSQEAQSKETPGLADGSDAPVSDNGLVAQRGTSRTAQEAREAADPRQGEGGGGAGGGRTLPNLRPTEEILDRALGGGSVDHLEDVAEGEVTALNAKHWKFASFLNRVKRQVAQNWDPARVMAMRDPTGKVYGVKNRITYLRVLLTPSGHILGIHVVKSSGVDVLDEEAIRAFKAAQPFPNPPEGLIDKATQQIGFFFGFHLDVAANSSWRLAR